MASPGTWLDIPLDQAYDPDWIRESALAAMGLDGYGRQIRYTQWSDDAAYSTILRNGGTGGFGLNVQSSDEADRLRVNDSGTFMDGSASIGGGLWVADGFTQVSGTTTLVGDDFSAEYDGSWIASAPTFDWTGESTFNGGVTITAGLQVDGNAAINGSLSAAAGMFSVNGATGGVSADGGYAAALGALTASVIPFAASATWNNAAVPFFGIAMTVTNTASAVTSSFIDCTIDGVSALNFNKNGAMAQQLGEMGSANTRPAISSTVEWTSGATTQVGWKLDVTDTASATASKLAQFKVGGADVLYVDKDGVLHPKASSTVGYFGAQSGAVYVGSESNHVFGFLRNLSQIAQFDTNDSLRLKSAIATASSGSDLVTGTVDFIGIAHAGAVLFSTLTANTYIDVKVDGVARKLYLV